MTPVGGLISRAAGRYLGVAGRAVLREVVAEARRAGARSLDTPAPPPANPRAVRLVTAGWWVGVAASAVAILNVDLLLPGRPADVVRVAVGGVLLVGGLALVADRLPVRRLLVARFAARTHAHPSRVRRSGWPKLVGAALTLLGIAWVAGGVLELLRGTLGLAG